MVRGGSLIKAARKARGMTQEYIAEASSTNVKTISDWENFKHEPKFCDVINIVVNICKLSLADAEDLIYAQNK